jgi:hypothetical protein
MHSLAGPVLAWCARGCKAGQRMRVLLTLMACLVLAQCATPGHDGRFRAGDSDDAYVIIGVAERDRNTLPHYIVLWRRLTEDGRFRSFVVNRYFEAATNEGDSVQVEGVPGEFTMTDIEPGTYALDSVYALVPSGRVVYVANGLIEGPQRPAFTVRAGEAVYLGIWEVNIEDSVATVHPWRLEAGDLRAVLEKADPVNGGVQMRQTEIVSVPCMPHRLSNTSQRQVC